MQLKKTIVRLIIFTVLPAPVLFLLYIFGFTFTLPLLASLYTISLVVTLAFGRFKTYLVVGFIIGIGLVGGIFLLLILVGGMRISIPPNKCDFKIGYETEEGKSIPKHEVCIYKLAQEKNDHHLCEKINYPELIIECVAQVAITKKDPQLCQELIYYPISVEVSGLQWVCLSEVALALHDESLCNDIDDPVSRSLCHNSFVKY